MTKGLARGGMPKKASSDPNVSLKSAIESLMLLYPTGEVLSDPVALILWENIGYLIDDTKRAQLFAEFKLRVGLSPQAIARVPETVLREIAERGGMRPETRVERLRRIAQLVLEEHPARAFRASEPLVGIDQRFASRLVHGADDQPPTITE